MGGGGALEVLSSGHDKALTHRNSQQAAQNQAIQKSSMDKVGAHERPPPPAPPPS